MTLQIAVCDDMLSHREALTRLLAADSLSAAAMVSAFDSAHALRDALDGGRTFDVLFLDIELGSDSGIRLAQQINAQLPASQIVFVTANIINAVDISDANHVYFLVKPVDADKLHRALERAIQQCVSGTDRKLRLPLHGASDLFLSAAQLVYCERVKRTTTLFCTDGTYYTPVRLDELETELPLRLFARPHNSFLVNLAHVSRLERFCVTMDTDAVLPVSNQRRNAFRDALSAFVSQF